MDVEDVSFGLYIRQRELDLPVDATRPNQRRIETFNLVRGHDHFYVPSFIKTVELVQQFQHRPLDLPRASGLTVVSFGTDGVDLVDENDRRRQVVRDAKQLSDE